MYVVRSKRETKNVEETKSTQHMVHTCLSWKSTDDGSKALLFVGRFKKPFDLSFPIADTDWIHPHQMLAYLLDLSSLRVHLEITFKPTVQYDTYSTSND